MEKFILAMAFGNVVFNVIKLIAIFCLIYNATDWNGFIVFVVSYIILFVWNCVWAFVKGFFGIL